jgi:hypothetical protein
MTVFPVEILRALAALPEGKPSRVVLHTNGHGEWKVETTTFDSTSWRGPVCNLSALVEEAVGWQLTKASQ